MRLYIKMQSHDLLYALGLDGRSVSQFCEQCADCLYIYGVFYAGAHVTLYFVPAVRSIM